jgi:iron(III) transport system substrate-binding protein
MKAKCMVLPFLLLFALSASLAFSGGGHEAVTGEEYPAEMEEWLKAAKLGPYEDSPQDWAEIERLAKQEGRVVVYSSSSRIANVAEAFEAAYPQIKLEGYDLGSVQTLEKTIREQEAGVYNADIVTTGGSGQVIYELLAKNRIVNFVPDTVGKEIPKEMKDPLLVRINEAIVFFYNKETYPDAPPIENIWELTTEKWRGKVVLKNPLESESVFMGICTLVEHADEMAAAYRRFAGKKLELSPDVPDAGYEFLYRLLKNDMVLLSSGSKSAEASGKKGQVDPPISIGSFTYFRYNATTGYANEVFQDLDPVSGVIYPTYTGIARQAPHPNAAKLLTAFLLGSPKINPDSVIEEPYTEGKSVELLQGLAPYYEMGSESPRKDVPPPVGGEIWDKVAANCWTVSPEFMWYEAPKVQDFWVQESSR